MGQEGGAPGNGISALIAPSAVVLGNLFARNNLDPPAVQSPKATCFMPAPPPLGVLHRPPCCRGSRLPAALGRSEDGDQGASSSLSPAGRPSCDHYTPGTSSGLALALSCCPTGGGTEGTGVTPLRWEQLSALSGDGCGLLVATGAPRAEDAPTSPPPLGALHERWNMGG